MNSCFKLTGPLAALGCLGILLPSGILAGENNSYGAIGGTMIGGEADSGSSYPGSAGWFVPAGSSFQKFYWGFGYGAMFTDYADSVDDGSVSNVDDGDEGTVFNIYLGYTINDFLSVEAGFASSDDVDYEADSDGSGDSWVAGDVSADYEAEFYSLFLVGRYPVTSRLTLLGRLGLTYWETRESFNENGFTSSQSDSGSSIAVGAGFEYDIGVPDRFKIRGELGYHHINDDDLDVGTASVGVVYDLP